MRRRRLLKTLVALPAAPALMSQQQTAPPISQTPAAPPPAGGRGGGGRGGGTVPKLDEVSVETVGEPAQRFFTAAQFSALRKLSEILMPPARGNPGALECGAPEFLDFLIGASTADRQKLYRNGLDTLNTNAKKKYNKGFADLSAAEADAVIRPLLAPVPWVYDPPKDPAVHFVTEAHRDIRTATQNSREWADASAAAGRRAGGGGAFINPIDPI